MQHELFIALLAGLGGMFGWGLADLFAKKTIDSIGDTLSLLWAHIFGSILLVLFLLYQILINHQSFTFPSNINSWLLVIFFGVLQAVVYLLVYRGFGKGQVAVLNPVFASFSGLTALLSIIFLGEVVSGHLLFSLGIIFFGVMLLNIDVEALKTRHLKFTNVPGFKEVITATVLAAFWTLFWDKFIGGKDWLVHTLFMYLFMTIVIFAVAKMQKLDLRVKTRSMWKFLVLIGLFETGAYLAISIGYSKTSLTSVIALLSGAFSLPTIVFARLFLKEKVHRLQTIGSIIIIAGIIVLSVL